MLKIAGRIQKSSKKNDEENGEWSVEELASFIKEGYFVLLSLEGYFLSEKKEEFYATASMLTLYPNETVPYEKDDNIIVPTYFRNMYLPFELREGEEDELTAVDCIIPMTDSRLHATISKPE